MGNTVLLIVALALVSLWTGRLAHSKGRNPWLWGGASFAAGHTHSTLARFGAPRGADVYQESTAAERIHRQGHLLLTV